MHAGVRGYTRLMSLQRRGVATPCFVTMLLEDVQERGDKALEAQMDFDIRWTANSMYSGKAFAFWVHSRPLLTRRLGLSSQHRYSKC